MVDTPGNVDISNLKDDERIIYDRRLREAMPGWGDDPDFLTSLWEMWEENKTIKEAFFPEHWREENSGRFPAIGYGTKLRCICGSQLIGSHERGLHLPQSHGVSLSGYAAAHKKDRDAGEALNIRYFGVCSSVNHPLHTKSPIFADFFNMFKNSEKIILKSQNDPSKNVKGFECIPQIVGDWMNPYEGLRIASNESYYPGINAAERENFPIVTYESFLICRFGGLIEPVYPQNTKIEVEGD